MQEGEVILESVMLAIAMKEMLHALVDVALVDATMETIITIHLVFPSQQHPYPQQHNVHQRQKRVLHHEAAKKARDWSEVQQPVHQPKYPRLQTAESRQLR